MRTVFKYVLFFVLLLVTPSCTVYTEKQSEALSQTVYATKDSLEAARVDLADQYINEGIRIVKPPKQRIPIQSVYQTDNAQTLSVDQKPASKTKQRVVIVPEKYKGDKVIVVSSVEYDELMKDKQIHEQIKKDYDTLFGAKKQVEEELSRQSLYNSKMVRDLNELQQKLTEMQLSMLKKNITIVCLISSIIVGFYLRMKGIL